MRESLNEEGPKERPKDGCTEAVVHPSRLPALTKIICSNACGCVALVGNEYASAQLLKIPTDLAHDEPHSGHRLFGQSK